MLNTERMAKLTIIGPKSKMEDTIQACYALNIYHIVDHRKSAELDLGTPFPRAEQLSEILLKIRSLMAHLQIKANGNTVIRQTPVEADFFELGQRARMLYDAVTKILDARKALEGQLAHEQRNAALLEALAAVGLDPKDCAGTQRLAVLFGSAPLRKDLTPLLNGITQHYELLSAPLAQQQCIVIAVERTHESAMRQQLGTAGFSEFDAGSLAQVSQPTAAALADARQKLRQLHKAIAACNAQLAHHRQREGHFLSLNESLLTEEIKKAEAPLKFGTTKAGFCITGWVPKRKVQEAIKALNIATEQKIHIEISAVYHEEDVPIAFHNPKPAKPFQFFLEMFALPNYHEIDPTTLMLFTFPIFFGIMLGDVGYGILSAFLFLFLKRKLGKDAQPLLNIMLYAAVVSILFGFAFGEYFGFEHVSPETGEKFCGIGICLPHHEIEVHGVTETVADFPRLLNRMHGEMVVFGFTMPAVLVIGAIIGILHLNLGLFLGFLNGWHHHGFAHGLLEKAGWFVLEGAVAFLALSAMGLAPLWNGLLLLIAAAVLLYAGEGIQGLIEMPALFSNALSYMRLGAVGLASVGLAMVINEKFFLPMVAAGGIGVLFGILVMLIGHTVNLLLGIIGPFLHALRLHYVEFFTKFYKGGGIPYVPFGYGGGA